jgi:hypothetical protein
MLPHSLPDEKPMSDSLCVAPLIDADSHATDLLSCAELAGSSTTHAIASLSSAEPTDSPATIATDLLSEALLADSPATIATGPLPDAEIVGAVSSIDDGIGGSAAAATEYDEGINILLQEAAEKIPWPTGKLRKEALESAKCLAALMSTVGGVSEGEFKVFKVRSQLHGRGGLNVLSENCTCFEDEA